MGPFWPKAIQRDPSLQQHAKWVLKLRADLAGNSDYSIRVTIDDPPEQAVLSHQEAEKKHLENTGSGILRAAVFGVSDGLVSNLSLIMGVAGGSDSGEAIVIAGSAGLLAGAFSMAAGEYVSMKSQKESMENELLVEREHIIRYPAEEESELRDLLLRSGVSDENSALIASTIHAKVDSAVEFHAMLALGIAPTQLGSPLGAALASFLSFMIGALIPLLPFVIAQDGILTSIILSSLALLLVGAGVTRVTGKSPVFGALRQLMLGGVAATITYFAGSIIHHLLSGVS